MRPLLCAAHVQLKRHSALLPRGTLEEAAADATEPHLGVAVLSDAAHVLALLPEDPLHQAELGIVFQASRQQALSASLHLFSWATTVDRERSWGHQAFTLE